MHFSPPQMKPLGVRGWVSKEPVLDLLLQSLHLRRGSDDSPALLMNGEQLLLLVLLLEDKKAK